MLRPNNIKSMDATVKLILQIAAGILLAATVMGIGSLLVTYLTVQSINETAKEGVEQMNRISQQHQAKMEAQRQAQAAEAERKRQAQLAAQTRERQRKAEQQARAEDERRRQAAFERQYDAPEGCENPESERQFIECANDKIRARREFLGTYTLTAQQ
ncbi:hypothetical protein [Parahaliea mediterranea]|uniref:hypothetical protein n=1 Tax=Parahaliea mediterranea TaxID=651086 RepID=UPI000E2EA6B3|nr:hypothetical protein [Parahaliea mediterranea]